MKSNEILVALRRIMRAISLRSKQLEKQVGLTVPQLLVMQNLDEARELSVSEIARRVSLSQGTVTSVIDRLQAKGLLERVRSQSDKRKVSVSLSVEGRRQVLAAPGLLQEEFISRFEQLEDWEQKMLTSAVERIASLMDAGAVEASPILDVGTVIGGSEERGER